MMIYRDYGKTGKKVSLLGFGAMRFQDVDNHDECIQMMLTAAEGGVNYFDTAPGYFETRSETVLGEALAEMRRKNLPYYLATKTFKSTESEIRKEIEAQLKRLNIPSIDFYHMWCIKSPEEWQTRKNDGILQAFQKLKDEGLIKHICVSSHLTQDQIEDLLMEDAFEGVLMGYSAYNFKTREKAFNSIRAKNLGAVVMNPLGGGIVPQHPELFEHLKRNPQESTVDAALHFLWDHQDISVTLVGFKNESEVKEALHAMENYVPRTAAELEAAKSASSVSMEGLCTGCGYCEDCPQHIPIPKYMDAYNQKMLSPSDTKAIENRLLWHWGIEAKDAGQCIECAQCEASCTQHLPIISRLREISQLQ
ncbi:MAG: aldo/keto reductase [Treponema sp.]|jgi:predicted aldo/keto reductase-like oxidoreductase|nr:aldo/keto reductase [Treponema sp.]